MFFSEDQKTYALNKADPAALIYRDRNGQIYRLTAQQFKDQEDFIKWKHISDESYHGISNGEETYYKYKVSIGSGELISKSDDTEQEMEYRRSVLRLYHIAEEKLRKGLTQKQFRRFKMRTEDQLTEDEIARIENVGQPAISDSLSKAAERIKKLF